MAEYRIYLVTEDDHIATAPIRITCESDAAAIQQSQKLRASRDIQLWQERRLVIRLAAKFAA
jgi:hypothetical protein